MSSSQATNNKGTPSELSAFCPEFHRAVELIGRRWTGALVRALFGGPRRFNELLAVIPGLSDRLLTERLRELEREGIVRRDVSPGPPTRVGYALTERGAGLEPTIRALAAWAERWAGRCGDLGPGPPARVRRRTRRQRQVKPAAEPAPASGRAG